MSSISHPKRDFEEIRSRNPTNISILPGVPHVKSSTAHKRLSQKVQPYRGMPRQAGHVLAVSEVLRKRRLHGCSHS